MKISSDLPLRDEQLSALANIKDESIDLSDAPEASVDNWAHAERGRRPATQPVLLQIDVDVVNWFKSHSGDDNYKEKMSQILSSQARDVYAITVVDRVLASIPLKSFSAIQGHVKAVA